MHFFRHFHLNLLKPSRLIYDEPTGKPASSEAVPVTSGKPKGAPKNSDNQQRRKGEEHVDEATQAVDKMLLQEEIAILIENEKDLYQQSIDLIRPKGSAYGRAHPNESNLSLLRGLLKLAENSDRRSVYMAREWALKNLYAQRKKNFDQMLALKKQSGEPADETPPTEIFPPADEAPTPEPAPAPVNPAPEPATDKDEPEPTPSDSEPQPEPAPTAMEVEPAGDAESEDQKPSPEATPAKKGEAEEVADEKTAGKIQHAAGLLNMDLTTDAELIEQGYTPEEVKKAHEMIEVQQEARRVELVKDYQTLQALRIAFGTETLGGKKLLAMEDPKVKTWQRLQKEKAEKAEKDRQEAIRQQEKEAGYRPPSEAALAVLKTGVQQQTASGVVLSEFSEADFQALPSPKKIELILAQKTYMGDLTTKVNEIPVGYAEGEWKQVIDWFASHGVNFPEGQSWQDSRNIIKPQLEKFGMQKGERLRTYLNESHPPYGPTLDSNEIASWPHSIAKAILLQVMEIKGDISTDLAFKFKGLYETIDSDKDLKVGHDMGIAKRSEFLVTTGAAAFERFAENTSWEQLLESLKEYQKKQGALPQYQIEERNGEFQLADDALFDAVRIEEMNRKDAEYAQSGATSTTPEAANPALAEVLQDENPEPEAPKSMDENSPEKPEEVPAAADQEPDQEVEPEAAEEDQGDVEDEEPKPEEPESRPTTPEKRENLLIIKGKKGNPLGNLG